MDKKRVLVTGASGYIGSHVVSALLNMGHTVYASDIRLEGVDPRAVLVSQDLFSGDEKIFEKLEKPDICIHLAWRDGFNHNSDAHMSDLSKHYTFAKNMLEGGLRHIVFMGSMHEIGYWEGAIDENTPANPMNLYGIAKNSLRQSVAILAKRYGAVYQWLRGYYILGDDKKNHSIFTKLVKMEEEGCAEFPFNSGKHKYDFIDVFELAGQIASASIQEEVTGVINCCTGNPISLAEKVEEFICKNNFKIRLKYGAFPDRPYDSPAVWGDSTKITQIMNNAEKDI